jgi:hypothetical protein
VKEPFAFTVTAPLPGSSTLLAVRLAESTSLSLASRPGATIVTLPSSATT